MTKRIFRSILIVSLTVLLASLALTVGVLHGYFESRVEEELASRTSYIAHGVETQGLAYFDGLTPDCRITWVAADGVVLYDSREDAATLGNHADREEIRQALETGRGRSARYSDTLARKTLYSALRLSDGTVVRVADTQYSVWMLVVQVLQPVALMTLLAFALALTLAGRVARQIVRPINDLDLNAPEEEPEVYDELAPLLTKIRSQSRQIRRQMQELQRRQEEFTAITENMSEGLLVVDGQTRVLSCNSAGLRLLGAQEAAQGDTVYALNRESAFRRCVEEALAGRRCEQLLDRTEDSRQIIASPVEQDGAAVGAVLVILDVTEKEQRERLRREFTANVSHELKTPLTAISGTAEILENGLVRPEDVGHFAGNIRREAGRLIGLVNDIIKLSRLDEGGPDGAWETEDLYALARSVLEQVTPASASPGRRGSGCSSGFIGWTRAIPAAERAWAFPS